MKGPATISAGAIERVACCYCMCLGVMGIDSSFELVQTDKEKAGTPLCL
jgi:hypothetical protein